MEKFLCAQNTRRFVGLLEEEADHAKRDILHALLLEQEDRFGSRSERLQETSRFIGELEARIARQRDIISKFAAMPALLPVAEERLSNMLDTLRTLKSYTQHLVQAVSRDCP